MLVKNKNALTSALSSTPPSVCSPHQKTKQKKNNKHLKFQDKIYFYWRATHLFFTYKENRSTLLLIAGLINVRSYKGKKLMIVEKHMGKREMEWL